MIELDGPKRTASVRVFKGKILIDVREYYEVRSCGPLHCTSSNGADTMPYIIRDKADRLARCGRRKTARCFQARRYDAGLKQLHCVPLPSTAPAATPGPVFEQMLRHTGHLLDCGAV